MNLTNIFNKYTEGPIFVALIFILLTFNLLNPWVFLGTVLWIYFTYQFYLLSNTPEKAKRHENLLPLLRCGVGVILGYTFTSPFWIINLYAICHITFRIFTGDNLLQRIKAIFSK